MKKIFGICMTAAALVVLPAGGAMGMHREGHQGGPDSAQGPQGNQGSQGNKGTKGLAKRAAVRRCKEERRTLGKEAFLAKYGDQESGDDANAKRRHAMRNCIRQGLPEARADVRNASQECRAERTSMGVEAFRAKYGTNTNKRNAFGKCVSSKVKADEADADDTPSTPSGDSTPTTP